MAKEFSFCRKEKLKSRKLVEELFARGKSLNAFPVRISYQFLPLMPGEESLLQVGVSVSKRHFKKAVHRNRIKRLLREAYRLQKKELVELLKQKALKGCAFFIYTDKSLPAYTAVAEAVNKGLLLLMKKAAQTNEDAA